MAYKVINRFRENNHDGHVYEVGDTYPAEGKRLNKTRAEELTKKHAKYKKAYLVADEKKAEKPEKPSTDKAEKGGK